jgi:hypothetical protein
VAAAASVSRWVSTPITPSTVSASLVIAVVLPSARHLVVSAWSHRAALL